MNKYIVKKILDEIAHVKLNDNFYIINDFDFELVKTGLYIRDHSIDLSQKHFITYKQFLKQIQQGVNQHVVSKKAKA